MFKRSEGVGLGSELSLPCGQCIGCRLERSRQWAVRCMHESKLYDENVFLTLTYSDGDLPFDGSLNVRHFQLFMKRLRKRFADRKIRFFHCGEYGERLGRPHYHALIFNLDFPDKKFYKVENGNNYYTSKILDGLWGFGFVIIGAVTFESAAYVARYVTKKITGDAADDHYVNRESGCVLAPEYVTMSRRPGIASDWFKRFRSDVFPSDEVIVRGKSCKPPRFYDSIYEAESPDDFARVKSERVRSGILHSVSDDGTVGGESFGDRLIVREKVKRAEIRSLSRKLESGESDH